jgi:SNARE domain.
MVHDQGELIDSIEAHVERTEAYVSDGNTQLKDAAMYTVSRILPLKVLVL